MELEFKGILRAVDYINEQDDMLKSQMFKMVNLMAKDADVKVQEILQSNYGDFIRNLKKFQKTYDLKSEYSFLGKE